MSATGFSSLLVDTVLQALRNHVTHSEWHNMKSALPKDLATALP